MTLIDNFPSRDYTFRIHRSAGADIPELTFDLILNSKVYGNAEAGEWSTVSRFLAESDGDWLVGRSAGEIGITIFDEAPGALKAAFLILFDWHYEIPRHEILMTLGRLPRFPPFLGDTGDGGIKRFAPGIGGFGLIHWRVAHIG